ncbi:MAG: hypothetical protein KF760_26455 [Candidatus Eremiobacteraeota bacterium]|nr:hypothetical protein [Candidatus Eremiobacteraeota bacterium]MCW5869537.1 hypothetical protein [Candidatus Eremiobacteraeota bacterium]
MQIQSASSGIPRQLPKDWAVLVYNVGENDEGLMSTHNLLDLQQVGSDENTHVVCHNYRSPWLYEKLGMGQEHLGSRQYYVEREATDSRQLLQGTEIGHFASFLRSTPGKITSPELPIPEGKIHQAEHLKKFLLGAMKDFPARHYCLVMSGHGCGFAGQAVTAQGRMSNEELGQALREVAAETGQPLEVLNLNTCFSSSVEAMHALQGGARVAVGSQSTVCGATQPLGETLKTLQNSLRAGQSVSAEELGSLFVAEAHHQKLSNIYTPTLSAVDLTRMGALGDQIGQLHEQILEKQIDREVLRQALKDSIKLDYAAVPRPVQVTDLGSFIDKLGAACPELRPQCIEIAATLKETVLAEQHQSMDKESPTSRLLRPLLGKGYQDMSGYTGLTIYYEDRPDQDGHRLAQVENTALGRQWQIRRLVDYIHQGQEQPRVGKLKQIGEKIHQFEIKANKAIGIPYVVPFARRALKAALFIGAAAGLRHLGVPVAQAVFGPLAVFNGFKAALKGGSELGQELSPPGKLSLEQRDRVVDKVCNTTLGLTLGTFGLQMMGLLPASLAWPLAGVALTTHAARLGGKFWQNHSDVRAAHAQDAHFATQSTVREKLAVADISKTDLKEA